MTEENYKYRTSQSLLRNQFPGQGKLKIPMIPKFQMQPGDFDDLLLIGFDKTHLEDQKHLSRMVHFFLYDYRFERVWKIPENDIEKLSRYRAVLSPDFCMYLEMAPVMQLYNVFRNRWCGALWASKGMRVVPTVNWADEESFDYSFAGIEKGSVVAVSTYMASAHGNHADQKEWFMKGYNELLRRIEPEKIICYNSPFPEMQGDIVSVDYERSSWKYMSYEKQLSFEDLSAYQMGGAVKAFRDTIDPYLDVRKGGGSVEGGPWQPSKIGDERLRGEPNTVKTFFYFGYRIDVSYGPSGLADRERHYTWKPNAKYHSNPHDHTIDWEKPKPGQPNFSKPINYWSEDYPNGVPELKQYRREGMQMKYFQSTPDQNRFQTISEFKQCIISGGEPVFLWQGIEYGVTTMDDRFCIAKVDGSIEKWCDSADEVLEYMVGNDRLRDVIKQVIVTSRSL